MKLYPIAIGVFWLSMTIAGICGFFVYVSTEVYYSVCLFAQLYGIFVTLLYFYGSKQARQNWSRLLRIPDDDELNILDIKSIAFTNDSGSTEYVICDNDVEEMKK